MYVLQNRWRLEGRRLKYYGLRNAPQLLKNSIRVSKKQEAVLSSLPRALDARELRRLGPLVGEVVVKAEERRRTPSGFDEARFCSTCVANDFMIPGLSFDAEGRCPICQTAEQTRELRSVLPVRKTFPHEERSRFDIAVFYTGGKDSTYLLYYLSRVLGLRVLALTWEIPFMSASAKASIEGARRTLPSVEFLSRQVAEQDLKKIYRKLYALSGNTCACPSLAYVLFYPELVANHVPFFVAGNEPAQMLGLYYNRMAPRVAYRFAQRKGWRVLLGLGRLLTLRPPLKEGQLHTLLTMKQLAYGDHPVKRWLGYENRLVSNVCEAIREVPGILDPLKRAIRTFSRTGNIPAFVHVDLDAICEGGYEWRRVKDTIVRECGWVPPPETDRGLHTSCNIEKCKEYTQFIRFYRMESQMIPFSALEISIASRRANLSRAEAMDELRGTLGFSLEEIPECALMKEYLQE